MAHSLIIDNQKKVSITDVSQVNGFSEKEIKITLNSGEKISILGTEMKIINFAKDSGNFVAEGQILGVKYQGKSVNFIKRIIK